MQFIDLATQQARVRDKIDARIKNVLDHGQYILGPELIEFEKNLAQYTGTSFATTCASGTDAILMALMACGIGPGDAVITTPFTFVATAEVISLAGAVPVFVDVDIETMNIDPESLEKTIEAFKSGDSSNCALPQGYQDLTLKAVLPVDLFGLPADYDAITSIADKHDLLVIEDAAQSFGGEYKGKKACGFGVIGCTSFFPAKPLGCYGDGGAIFTNDEKILETLESIRVHGQGLVNKYENVRIGLNSRFDTLQAAIMLPKLEIFPEEFEMRQNAANKYEELLKDSVTLQKIPADCRSAWAQYSFVLKTTAQRTKTQAALKDKNIPSAVYYQIPLHLQKAYSFLDYKQGDFPASEELSQKIMSIPMHPYIKPEDQELVAETIKESLE